MSIDWLTVTAQLANFLLLVWLLKRFLYRPILDGIDAREREIVTRMSEADRIRQAAEAREDEYQAQVAELQRSRESVIQEVRRAAELERDTLLSQAREQWARDNAERERQRREEFNRYKQELHQSGAAALLALTRKALTELADETLEQRIVERTAQQITRLTEELKHAAGEDTNAVVSTFTPLPEHLQHQLSEQMAETLPGTRLHFIVDPTASPGLTLRLGGAQLSWTIDSYMDSLDEMLQEKLAGSKRGRPDAA